MMRARILLVDDETALARLLENHLKRLGYDVDSFSDPASALAAFQSAAPPFNLVIADMTMPGMSGEELLTRILELDGNVQALLCSGYPDAGSHLRETLRERVAFLHKPFLPKMLSDAVAQLLSPGE